MGNGLFAMRDLKAGTRILSERPLLIVPIDPTHATSDQNIDAFCLAILHPSMTRELLGVIGHLGVNHDLLVDASKMTRHWFQNNTGIKRTDPDLKDLEGRYSKLFCQYMENATRLPRQNASGIFYRYSFINHSCSPNAYSYYDPKRRSLKVHLARNVEAGDQIFVSYTSSEALPRAERRAELNLQGRKFICGCSLCMNDEADAIMQRIFTSVQTLTNFLVKEGAQVGQINPSFSTPNDSAEALAVAEQLVRLLQHRSMNLQGPKLKWALRICTENSRRMGEMDKAAAYAKEELALQVRLWGFDFGHIARNENAVTRLRDVEEERSRGW
ncbi:hypothetical protein Daus18300_000813 [Diaporthe australafricana]|uniref:SET domain-containing protein n=1 Tax=Diaporthe australafricana TaxID=127596 RepID=A0ABR3Y1B1_9PEZI